jgi:hypothetical protein
VSKNHNYFLNPDFKIIWKHFSVLSLYCCRWAKTTLQEHWNDEREVVYPENVLEKGQTKDELWNAAQLEMVCNAISADDESSTLRPCSIIPSFDSTCDICVCVS